MTKVAAICARVSSDRQKENHTIASQLAAPVRKHISCAGLINISRCGFGRASTRGRGCGR
jgi:hypothetical protein